MENFDGLYTEEDTTMDLEPNHFLVNNDVHMESGVEEDGGEAEQTDSSQVEDLHAEVDPTPRQ